MAIDAALRAALRPFERRALTVAFVTALSVSLLVVALISELGWLVGVRNGLALVALIAVAVVGSGIFAVSRRPAPLTLARVIDERAHLSDLVVSAIGCEGDGMAAAVRRSAIAALRQEPAAAAFPHGMPRHWRRWVLAAAVVQVAAVPLAVRAPATRAPQPDLSSLTLPTANGQANSTAKTGQPETPASSPTPLTSNGPSAPGSIEPPRATSLSGKLTQTNDGVSINGNAIDRLRLAAANAGVEMAAGRVPLARRAIVERYFAAIQTERKRPR